MERRVTKSTSREVDIGGSTRNEVDLGAFKKGKNCNSCQFRPFRILSSAEVHGYNDDLINSWTSCAIDVGRHLKIGFWSRSQTTFRLLRAKAVVVSILGRARRKLGQVCIRETNESEPFEDASLEDQLSSKPSAKISLGKGPLGA